MKKIVVTGGTGFVAGWVILEFLKAGYEVKTSVRSLKKADRVTNALAPKLSEEESQRLSFFEADLGSKDNWAENFKGMNGIIHVASPLGTGRESTSELVSIAKGGTLNVLKAAKEAGVNRVVMTSSQSASTPMRDFKGVLSEDFWTDINNPDLDPYRISKIESERAAWKFANENDLELTTLLPGAIFGPVLESQINNSNRVLKQLYDGLPLIPQIPLEIVDVRDLAHLHRLAFENDNAVGNRYLAASQSLTMAQVTKIYQQRYPKQHLHVRTMPNWIARLAAKFVPSMRTLVPMLNRKYHHTTAAAEKDLGWNQRQPEQTVVDTMDSIIGLHLD